MTRTINIPEDISYKDAFDLAQTLNESQACALMRVVSQHHAVSVAWDTEGDARGRMWEQQLDYEDNFMGAVPDIGSPEEEQSPLTRQLVALIDAVFDNYWDHARDALSNEMYNGTQESSWRGDTYDVLGRHASEYDADSESGLPAVVDIAIEAYQHPLPTGAFHIEDQITAQSCGVPLPEGELGTLMALALAAKDKDGGQT
jgi:hypothetical protein